MSDLTTTYLNLKLEHPVVASASPLSRTLAGIRRLEDAGAAAIVLFSLFEEQIVFEGDDVATALMPGLVEPEDAVTPEGYLELVEAAKRAVDIPIIASLNGTTDAGWTRYAHAVQQAGADAIELNIFHIPADITTSGRAVEQRYVDVVHAVRAAVRIPLAVKLGPYFSSMGDMARRLVTAGADGLVLFNRFYQPDFDVDHLRVVPSLELSVRAEVRLPLLWIAKLHGHLPTDLAATSGVETSGEVLKYLLAGATVVMTTSSLLRNGPEHIGNLVTGLRRWMHGRGYQSLNEIRGLMSERRVADPTAFERSNYIQMLRGYRTQV
jgi:dihydroorotate dehydrogenase (fumarate)